MFPLFSYSNKWVISMFVDVNKNFTTHANSTTAKMQCVCNVVEFGPVEVCFLSARYAVTLHIPHSDRGIHSPCLNRAKLLFYRR